MNKDILNIIILSYFPKIHQDYIKHSFFEKLTKSQNIKFHTYSFLSIKKTLQTKMPIDDKSYGGSGMVLRFDFAYECIKYIEQQIGSLDKYIFIHPSPSGREFGHQQVHDLSSYKGIFFLCSRYEGIDERIINYFGFLEYTIGNYILYDGDTPSMVMYNAIIRNKFVKKVAHFSESLRYTNLVCGGSFTRPKSFMGHTIHHSLYSGNYHLISKYKHMRSLIKTGFRYLNDIE